MSTPLPSPLCSPLPTSTAGPSSSNTSPPTSSSVCGLRPLILLTHTRSLSTAFARIFLTHPEIHYVHEPFGDAFYFGPEKISPAFSWEALVGEVGEVLEGVEGEEARKEKERKKEEEREMKRERCVTSGCAEVRYADVVTRIEEVVRANPAKRVFIKDMAYHIITPYPESRSSSPPSLRTTPTALDTPPNNQSSAPGFTSTSTISQSRVNAGPTNPTVLPTTFLSQFQITILIRRPELSVPSKFKFTVPPLAATTQIEFLEKEIGYCELRMMVQWLETRETRETSGEGNARQRVIVLDADDLTANPVELVRKYAELTGLPFEERMLRWDNSTGNARDMVKKYEAYHGDVMDSKGFGSFGGAGDGQEKLEGLGSGRQDKGLEERRKEWRSKFGKEGEESITRVVERDNVHYRWLWERRLRL